MIRTAEPRSDVCAAILCGGASRRMGVPKAGLLLPDGRSMIETIRDVLEHLCEQVVLVGNPHGLRGHAVVEDERPDSGPLAGIEALLRSGIAARYLVVPCDMPTVPPGALRRLMDAEEGGVVHFDAQPLPCLVEASQASKTTQLLEQGVRALRAWQEAVEAHQIDPEGARFEDADTPEEFITLWRQFVDHDPRK